MMPFPISETTPIRFPGPPPAACDVVVIGTGPGGEGGEEASAAGRRR